MQTKRYRAWKFIHPDLDSEAQPFIGLGVTTRGNISMIEGEQAVRQAVVMLLSTVPGERIMRPQYGCHIHSLAFYPNDDTTAGLAIHYVKRALARWETRIDVLHVDANRDDNVPEQLNILLEYRVRATQRTEKLTVSLNLAGAI